MCDRTTFWLLISSSSLFAVGILALTLLIPWAATRIKSDANTEFYSARAAYWAIVVSLLLFAAAFLGTVTEHVIRTVKRGGP